MDLISLNLQRGRDHGLQGYNAFRELCGFGRAEKFDQLSDLIPAKIVERLKLIYADVDDVDLFIGGISEAASVGSLLGPTFQVLYFRFQIQSPDIDFDISSALLEISSRGFNKETGAWSSQKSLIDLCFSNQASSAIIYCVTSDSTMILRPAQLHSPSLNWFNFGNPASLG